MENSPITLISPFSYQLTLSIVSNSIISTFQSLTSQKSFTCKVKNMTSADLRFLSQSNSSFYLRQFHINHSLESISFTPGLKGGGNNMLCRPIYNQFKANALSYLPKEDQNKLDEQVAILKECIANLTVTEGHLEEFSKIHPLTLDTIELFTYFATSLLSQKIRSHPLIYESI